MELFLIVNKYQQELMDNKSLLEDMPKRVIDKIRKPQDKLIHKDLNLQLKNLYKEE